MGCLWSAACPANGVGHGPIAANYPPPLTNAEVSFLIGERPAAERITQRLFGRLLHPDEYAGLAGAPDGARVEVGTSGNRLYIELGDPATAAYRAYFYVRRIRNRLVLLNEGFRIALIGLRRRGFGLQMFQRQAAAAAALGIARIELVAGRRGDENGYYTWPRYGFDGALPNRVRRRLPMGLDAAETVLDLMSSIAGRAWWREHGETIAAVFDLSPASRSQAVLRRYINGAEIFASGPKTNLETSFAMSYGKPR